MFLNLTSAGRIRSFLQPLGQLKTRHTFFTFFLPFSFYPTFLVCVRVCAWVGVRVSVCVCVRAFVLVCLGEQFEIKVRIYSNTDYFTI